MFTVSLKLLFAHLYCSAAKKTRCGNGKGLFHAFDNLHIIMGGLYSFSSSVSSPSLEKEEGRCNSQSL